MRLNHHSRLAFLVCSALVSLSACGGSDGAPGPQGDPGDTGPAGDVGDTGKPGATGDQGDPGEDGEPGDQGDTGDTGEKGDTGDDGDPGTVPDAVTVEDFTGVEGDCTNGGVKITVESDPPEVHYVCAADRYRAWNFLMSGSSVSSERVIFDEKTGRMWQRDPLNGLVAFPSLDWPEANDYCNNLDYAGFTDWTLPGPNALYLLVLLGQTPLAPTIDREFFPNTPEVYFWTAEEVAGDHFGVDFATGDFNALASGAPRGVRCMR